MRFIITLFLALVLLSCCHHSEQKVEFNEGEQVEMSLSWLPELGYANANFTHPFRFVVSINLSCEACLYEIKRWEELIASISFANAYVCFIIAGHNDAFRNYINASETIGNLWHFDADNSFYTKNDIVYNDNRTFVLDSLNRIVFRGSVLFEDDFQIVKEYGMSE